MKIVYAFKAYDGKIFNTESECRSYEKSLPKKYEIKFLNNFNEIFSYVIASQIVEKLKKYIDEHYEIEYKDPSYEQTYRFCDAYAFNITDIQIRPSSETVKIYTKISMDVFINDKFNSSFTHDDIMIDIFK